MRTRSVREVRSPRSRRVVSHASELDYLRPGKMFAFPSRRPGGIVAVFTFCLGSLTPYELQNNVRRPANGSLRPQWRNYGLTDSENVVS